MNDPSSEIAEPAHGDPSIKRLTADLKSTDLRTLRRAVESLAVIGDPQAVDLLLQISANMESPVRIEARAALGRIGGDLVARHLIAQYQALNRPTSRLPYEHQALLMALAETQQPEAVDFLLAIFQSSDSGDWRYVARPLARALEGHPDRERAIVETSLQELLSQPEKYERVRRLLGAIRPDYAIDRLLAAANDENFSVLERKRFISVLKATRHPAASPGLIEFLSKTDNGNLRYAASLALKRIRSRKDLPKIIALLNHDSWHVRACAAGILQVRRVKAAEEALLPLLEDSHARVRGEAGLALSRIKSEQAVPGIVRLLSDRSWKVRRMAIDALLHLLRHRPQAVLAEQKSIQPIFEDDDPRVARRASTLEWYISRR